MANVNDTSGPAFPTNGMTIENWHAGIAGPGMTLRDWFAGQALVGMLAVQPSDAGSAVYAAAAYTLADAMLAAREGKP